MIFGRPGSGKSTFALKLSRQLNLPLYHLDRFFYRANWVERNYTEFLDTQQALVDERNWIIDGNATKSLEMRYAHAHIVLYFNFPRLICYWRIFKRLFARDSDINDRATGCHEKIRWSLVKYTWTFQDRVTGQINNLKEKYPHIIFMEICSHKDLKNVKRFFNPA
jgi:adenylate kinase family enzyme